MTAPRQARDPQRGNSLLLALIVMSSLATLGSLTVVSVQSSLKASTNDRSQTVAMYAAESGGAAAMEYLRQSGHFDANFGWSAYVLPNGQLRQLSNTTELLSNGALPGDPKNLFSPDLNAFFVVELSNNRDDPNYGAAVGQNDHDSIIVIRSTGHGPQGSVAIVEWEIQRIVPPSPLPPPAPQPAPTDPLPLTPPPPWVDPGATKGLHIRAWRTIL